MPTTTKSDLPHGIGNPARNALALIGVTRLSHVARHTESELLALHGVGPKAIRVLREVLAERGRAFKAEAKSRPTGNA